MQASNPISPITVSSQVQAGHILLLMTLLLSTGGGAMLLYQVNRVSLARPVDRALAARTAVVDARTALLAYSADYAALYGPTGAGPGHLPCPDTDDGDDPRLDGPDPPCGRGQIASGALPRHVTLSRQRFAFHDEPDQRIRYAVSTGYVNNPLNRFVNAGGALEQFESEDSRFIASLSIPVIRRFDSESEVPMTSVFITRHELMDVVRPWVMRWIIDRVVGRLMLDCLRETTCSKFPELFEDGSAVDGEVREVRGVDLIRWLSDPDTGFIEAVPASRHWFVRNRWFEDVLLRISAECNSMQSMQSMQLALICEFVPASNDSALPLIITFQRKL